MNEGAEGLFWFWCARRKLRRWKAYAHMKIVLAVVLLEDAVVERLAH